MNGQKNVTKLNGSKSIEVIFTNTPYNHIPLVLRKTQIPKVQKGSKISRPSPEFQAQMGSSDYIEGCTIATKVLKYTLAPGSQISPFPKTQVTSLQVNVEAGLKLWSPIVEWRCQVKSRRN